MPDPNRPVSEGKIAALKRLKLAYDDAEDAGEEPRQFAATKDDLMADGATASDLFWLIKMHYVEHMLDITRDGETRRQFRAATAPVLRENSCFILTYAGKIFVDRNGLRLSATASRPAQHSPAARLPAERIRWDKRRHELSVEGKLAKQFRHAAPMQWVALDQFEADGWRGPVEVDPGGDPERDTGQRVRELVAELNTGLDQSLIHFRKDCHGNRITFDLP